MLPGTNISECRVEELGTNFLGPGGVPFPKSGSRGGEPPLLEFKHHGHGELLW
jgi:hypothetical protein